MFAFLKVISSLDVGQQTESVIFTASFFILVLSVFIEFNPYYSASLNDKV